MQMRHADGSPHRVEMSCTPLEEAGTVTGRVTDATTGEAISTALVQCHPAEGTDFVIAVEDERGRVQSGWKMRHAGLPARVRAPRPAVGPGVRASCGNAAQATSAVTPSFIAVTAGQACDAAVRGRLALAH